MTAGYGSAGYGPADGEPADGRPRDAETPAPAPDRPGPLPPRIEPPRTGSAWPAAPAPGVPAQPGPPVPPGVPTQPGAFAHPGVPAQPGAFEQSGVPAQPGGPVQMGGPGVLPHPANPAAAPAGWPPAGPPAPAWPASGPGYPVPGAVPPPRARRRRWLTVTAALVVLVLAGLAGFQAYQIDRLTDRLAATDRRLAEAQSGDGSRFDGLEKRAEALEKQAGATFNPEAVASAVLPSVFRVRAGQFTGTAFAIGKPAAGGGTNLFTNFHVVEAVWDSGGREVFLERTDQRFPATIVKVDKTNDIAHLRTTGKFSGLAAAPDALKSGQQIVVVGAPLGLEDSVTTGVVSAIRKAEPGGPPAIQFDAPINPGNSGGPVINGNKQVVGIATAKARDAEGIGLAVPIKTACDGFKIC
ncbi:trypsin-like peptidase domain-containing protein [Micromonospora sp. WMMD812]|uniref:trypsin-like peptidase domain-containing protein n=1 Tax=Micromonospora sp. WMMD812 TaxID=3015152 RepID=UPI00248B938F|nr:trypsin-like peptidase domain-containing protein [Micromonospora sp. WMMD812]WBB70241.1 trypsin-like peptidase domain-containing protein [Micromonospora sp. WMMD812]